MDLKLSPEHEAFRAEVRAFLADNRDRYPRADGGGRPSESQRAWQRLLIEHGYAARTIPREYGGYGGEPDILKSRIIAEAFTEAGAPGGLAGQGISMLVPTLLELGTEEQKRQFIARRSPATSSGARATPSPAPAPTSPPCARRLRGRRGLRHQRPEDLDLHGRTPPT
jgi:alkylation response protein AidB-like acyl-CoA dehydrogenase